MAEERLKFTIGSAFSGEGFKAAQQSVQSMNGSIKKGAATAAQMSAALGGLDASASKAMGAMTGMIGALVSMNATVIITQAAMLALNAYISKMNEEMEELTKRTEKLKAATDKAFSAALTESVANTRKEVASISSDFERITKQANAFTAALEGLRGSVATGGIVNLEVEKVNALLEAHSEAERQTIEATYNLKIAHEKAIAVEQAWSEKVEAANQAVIDSKNRVASIDEQLAKLGEDRRALEETMLAAKASGEEKWRDIQAQVNKLKDEEAALEQKRLDTMAETDVLEVKAQQAKQDAVNAEQQATVAVKNAELAEQKLTEAKHNREVSEQAAKEAADLDKAAADRDRAAREEEARVREEAKTIQQEVNDGAKDLKDAQREYAEALRKYEANFADNKMWESFFGALVKPLQSLNLGGGGLDQAMTEQAIKNAIANGDVRTVKDLDRFARDAQRAARNQISQSRTQIGREKQRYERLMDQNRKTWSKADADFVQKFEKLKAAAEAQKKDLDEKKARLEAAKKRDEDNHKNLEEIAKRMKELGLK